MAFTQEHVVIYEVGDDFDIERPDTGNLRAKQVAISYFTLTKYGELYTMGNPLHTLAKVIVIRRGNTFK